METLKTLLAVLIALPIIGAAGFMSIEGWNLLDALYMSIITISTVGYMEVHPLSDPGKVFVIIYLVFGLGFFLYSVAAIGEIAFTGELKTYLVRRAMERKLGKLKDHYIICGGGRMGMSLAEHLHSRGKPFVVIGKRSAGS